MRILLEVRRLSAVTHLQRTVVVGIELLESLELSLRNLNRRVQDVPVDAFRARRSRERSHVVIVSRLRGQEAGRVKGLRGERNGLVLRSGNFLPELLDRIIRFAELEEYRDHGEVTFRIFV